MESQHLSVYIRRSVDDVYAYAANPSNLPAWAEGLSSGIELVNGDWTSISPMGKVIVEMIEPNDLGVLDHWVTTSDGSVFYNPMRVIEAGHGCEVVFTLRRQPGMSDDSFETDAIAIITDLSTLKGILERG
ncbi:MAG: SRPBCC family protein [Salinibacterium sp.]|nr:SRPBCC family protein [Salinibacterium sp.]